MIQGHLIQVEQSKTRLDAKEPTTSYEKTG